MHDFSDSPPIDGPEPRRQGVPRIVWWLVGGGAAFVVLVCGGLAAGLMYIGVYGPETSVYTGNRVPKHFIDTAKSVGALEEGEELIYFYSDAMSDIRDGFYFLSDRKVAVYSELAGASPLTTVAFEEIEDVELFRDDSFFVDSEITIHLTDGRLVSFPVSSEFDRDEDFFDAIRDRSPRLNKADKTESETDKTDPANPEPDNAEPDMSESNESKKH